MFFDDSSSASKLMLLKGRRAAFTLSIASKSLHSSVWLRHFSLCWPKR